MQLHRFKKAISLGVSLLLLSLSIQSAHAKSQMVSTATAVKEQKVQDQRETVRNFINRDEIQNQLISLGVGPDEAIARVEYLTDSEVEYLTAQIENAPAGAGVGTIVGAAVFIFIVLLITDILGLTRAFSFTRSI